MGNLDSARDWGHAKDYVRAMHQMLQLEEPNDYVFASLGMNYEDYVLTDKKYIRPLELNYLKGDPTKFIVDTNSNFKFEYTFESMLDEMISHWMENINE
jgi:GDPmannose 4,6-dehydratase